MIEKLQHQNPKTANQIKDVFHQSYSVEAKLLEATDFPPLKRTIESYMNSQNAFYGYFEHKVLAGIIEIESKDQYTDINSLVVHPNFFRRGIASKLLDFLLKKFDSSLYTVETGVKNIPAIALYSKFGFKETKQWDTDFGVRKVLFEKRSESIF